MTRRSWGSVYRRRDREGLWIRFTEHGRRRVRGPFATVRAAEERLRQERRRIEQPDTPLLADWLADVWLPHRARTVEPSTFRYNQHYALAFAEWAGDGITVRGVTRDLAQRWIDSLALAPATKRTARAVHSAAWSVAVGSGIADENVWKAVKTPRVVAPGREYLSNDDVDRLCRHAGRAAPAILFLSETALRVGEFCLLDWRDFTESEVLIRGAITKSGRSRVLPLSARAKSAIVGLRELRHSRALRGPHRVMPYTAQWIRAAMKKASKDAGLPHLTPHALRHAWASRAVRALVPFPTVAKWLDHTDARLVAARYGRWAPKNELDLALSSLEAASSTRPASSSGA